MSERGNKSRGCERDWREFEQMGFEEDLKRFEFFKYVRGVFWVAQNDFWDFWRFLGFFYSIFVFFKLI